MSHLIRSGEMSARRLPTVIERKLARCQWSSGQISLISQASSVGGRNHFDPRRCVTEDNS